jgi:hypothetical protein
MTVVELPQNKEQVVLCLHRIVERVTKLDPMSAFGFFRNTNLPLFIERAMLEIGNDGKTYFLVDGIIVNQENDRCSTSWRGDVDEILVDVDEDGEGIVIKTTGKPTLTMYL